MTESFQIIGEDRSLRSSRTFVIDGICFVRSVLRPGYWVKTSYADDTANNQLTSVHIITEGYYADPKGVVATRKEGWISSIDDAITPKGVSMRQAPEGCTMWCIRRAVDPGLGLKHLSIQRVLEGCESAVPNHHNVFVLEGNVECATLPLHTNFAYKTSNEPKLLMAREASTIAIWPTSSVL